MKEDLANDSQSTSHWSSWGPKTISTRRLRSSIQMVSTMVFSPMRMTLRAINEGALSDLKSATLEASLKIVWARRGRLRQIWV